MTTLQLSAEHVAAFTENHKKNDEYYGEPRLHYGRRRADIAPVPAIPLQVGDRVKFYDSPRYWTVTAENDRFAVLARLAAFTGTPLYTIISWEEGRRGPQTGWGYGANTPKNAQKMLEALTEGKTELSERNAIHLAIEKVVR